MTLLDFFRKKPEPPKKVVIVRNYAAAKVNRLTADWTSSIGSADSMIHAGLRVIRARSRELAMNNDYARRFLKRTTSNVIGCNGIRLQPLARDTNGELDKIANDIIQEQWTKWGKKGTCTTCGRMSWIDAQKMFLESIARDGEIIVRLVKGFPNEFGFALQFIEADHLDEQLNTSLNDGFYIRMGVEFDKWNRPVAYHISTQHPGDNFGNIREQKRERIKAEDIIHDFILERPSQSRGVPWMHTAMTRLNMLGAYEEAELIAARVGASKMGFFVSPDGAGYTGQDEEDGAPIMEADPGTFEQLPSGMDFKTFDPDHPVTAFGDFEKAILRGVASGLDISYNTLANDLEGVNFSSIRQGSLEDRDTWRILQKWVIEHFCNVVYESWLLMAMTTKAVNLPVTKFDKFNNPSWKARGWQWIDPQKENNANNIAINQGTKSRTMIAAEQGVDVEEVFEQLALEKELAEKHGISISNQPQPTNEEVTDDDEKQDDNDKKDD